MNALPAIAPSSHPDEATARDAISRRDPAYDGSFVFAVITTGIFCRPSCPSRLARPENIVLFNTAAEAETAGFRACKRCRPTAAHHPRLPLMRAACAAIAAAEDKPDLAALAATSGLSLRHFYRMFREIVGVTPHQYARHAREKRLRTALAATGTVTQAMYDAGYGSASRLYEDASTRFGMTPGKLKRGGEGESISVATLPTSLGLLLVAATPKGVCSVALGDDQDHLLATLKSRFPRAHLQEGDARFARFVADIAALLESPSKIKDIPIDMRGTAFQLRVWQALRQIPPGETISYTELARRVGAAKSVRAVASACARNDLALVVPCHRVVRSDGDLAGYRWGIGLKRALLQLERKAD